MTEQDEPSLVREGPAATWARHILVVVAACTLAGGPIVHAEPDRKVPRIGYFAPHAASDPELQQGRGMFLRALGELGYVEGRNITIEYRYGEGKNERLPRLAAELVRAKVDVIVAIGGVPSARAAQQATTTIPVVMSGAVDPVGTGLVASLARPGGNITGLTIIPEELVRKQLELLKEAFPKVSRVAVLWNPDNPGNARQLREAEAVSGLQLEPVGARDSTEIEKAFVTMTERRADAVIVLLEQIFIGERERIADLAMRHRLPSVYGFRLHADAGGLMAYGASRVEVNQQIAFYVTRILKGARPSELPVAQPTKFELVINTKTARALGLTLPQKLLLRADEVIP